MKYKLIQKGEKNDYVGNWQLFLRGEGIYFGLVDDDFGNGTHEATIKFQQKYKLEADGKVGEATYKKAIELGFVYEEDDNDENKKSLLFPPKPDFNPIVGNETREKIFGKIQFIPTHSASNPEGIKIVNDFESKNIVRVNLPALSKATGGKFTAMRWHKSTEHQLTKFFEKLEKENLHTRILSFAGAFYPRFIRGSRTQLSNHSWGTAFDINVPQNGLNKTPALVGEKGSIREIVPIANDFGFYWGGHFTRKDGMHFEIAKIINNI